MERVPQRVLLLELASIFRRPVRDCLQEPGMVLEGTAVAAVPRNQNSDVLVYDCKGIFEVWRLALNEPLPQ